MFLPLKHDKILAMPSKIGTLVGEFNRWGAAIGLSRLLHAVDDRRMRQTIRFQDRRSDIDDATKL
jgi:hypothetical protein